MSIETRLLSTLFLTKSIAPPNCLKEPLWLRVTFAATNSTFEFSGDITSVSAPLIAGLYGVNDTAVNHGADPYRHTANLNDVTSGTNGTCTVAYLCTAVAGYDGPTGLGTPNGIAAFGL